MPLAKNYYRIVILQRECWARNKKRWAKALGAQAKALRAENPGFATL